jgi:hypothetical protein
LYGLLGKILKINPRSIDKNKIKKIHNVFTETVFDVIMLHSTMNDNEKILKLKEIVLQRHLFYDNTDDIELQYT